jgi:hypothetical protein
MDLEASGFYVCSREYSNDCPEDVFDPSAYCRAVKAYWCQSFGFRLRSLRLGEEVLVSREGLCSVVLGVIVPSSPVYLYRRESLVSFQLLGSRVR